MSQPLTKVSPGMVKCLRERECVRGLQGAVRQHVGSAVHSGKTNQPITTSSQRHTLLLDFTIFFSF